MDKNILWTDILGAQLTASECGKYVATGMMTAEEALFSLKTSVMDIDSHVAAELYATCDAVLAILDELMDDEVMAAIYDIRGVAAIGVADAQMQLKNALAYARGEKCECKVCKRHAEFLQDNADTAGVST